MQEGAQLRPGQAYRELLSDPRWGTRQTGSVPGCPSPSNGFFTGKQGQADPEGSGVSPWCPDPWGHGSARACL